MMRMVNSGRENPARAAVGTIVVAAILLGSCAASPSTSTVIHTTRNVDAGHPGFRNVLVIGVAGDFESRAMFEAELAAALSSETVAASAYYTVVGRRPQLSRTLLRNAIRAREFDAVIFTRQQGQEQQDLAPLRPIGTRFDLFGYDYEELNRDTSIRQAAAITFVTEFYATGTQEKIWAIDSLSFDKQTASALISEQVRTIAAELRKDGLLAR